MTRQIVQALLRPLLTWLCMTLPAWLEHGTHARHQAVMTLAWRARQLYQEGKHGDGL